LFLEAQLPSIQSRAGDTEAAMTMHSHHYGHETASDGTREAVWTGVVLAIIAAAAWWFAT
jgi:hypothetical protein